MSESLSQNTPSQESNGSFQTGWLVAGLLASVLVLVVVFYDSLALLGRIWWGNENYGHGLFVPPIALYLAWENRKRLCH